MNHPTEIPLWRQRLRSNFVRWDALADFLELDETNREKILKKSHFPLNLPRRLAEKIEKNCWEDPLLKQFVPSTEELIQDKDYVSDPVGDIPSRKTAKLLHKYEGRVLMLPTSACAMHCRYCFRQHYDYEVSNKVLDKELDLIRQDSTIHEVILSGGDPLSMGNDFLSELLDKLAQIEHVKRLRFHSRFIMGIPERIDEEFIQILKRHPHAIWFVIHANHIREFDNAIWEKIKLMQECGIVVLCQSVLLRGVNDSVEALVDLFEGLANRAVLPYYLHQLDRVSGGGHFEVEEFKGLDLMEKAARLLPGYAVPKYVKEVAGVPYKLAVIND